MCVARMTICNLIRERIDNGTGKGELGRTDVGHGGRDADLDAGVSFLCQLALEELVQFGVEDAVGDELPTFGNGGSGY